jgi:hypothetical protein
VEKIPKVFGAEPFERMNFYSWLGSRYCVFKGLSSNLKLSAPMPAPPPTRAVLIGRFFHKVMEKAEEAKSLESLEDEIEVLIRELQMIVSTEPVFKKSGAVSGWTEINSAATRAIEHFQRPFVGNRATWLETTLVSKNGKFSGQPDKFCVKEREAVVFELKSGKIRDEAGVLLKEYLEQVHFYSYLISEQFEIENSHCEILSLSGDKSTLDLKRDQIREHGERFNKDLENTNIAITSATDVEVLQNPSEEACLHCNKKVICRAFAKTQKQFVPSGNFVIRGSVKTVSSPASSQVLVEVLDSVSRQRCSIEVPAKCKDDLKNDAEYLFSELGFNNGRYQVTPRSRIYEC